MRDDREITNIIANDFGANATYVEDLLRQFQHNPHSVGEEWGNYFQSILGANGATQAELQSANGVTSPAAAGMQTGAQTGAQAGGQAGSVATKAAPSAS